MVGQQQGTVIFPLHENDETPALPFKLKLANRVNILRCFRDGKEHTVSEVSRMTGISKITTMRAVQFFCEKGVLVTGGKVYQNNSGGKYPEIFRLNINKYILSITLWPGIICLKLTDFSGTAVHMTENNEVDTHHVSVSEIEQVLRSLLETFLEEAGVDRSLIYGVAVSTAGIIDYRNKRIRYNAQAPGWGSDIAILDSIREYFPEDTYFFLENGAKAMARALLLRPEVAGKRVLLITTTWGIGGCMIQNGRILNGRNSLIGEVGHIVLDKNDSEQCSCGSYGCLERLVSISRIRRMLAAETLPEESPLFGRDPETVTLMDVFKAAGEGDETALKLTGHIADCFAEALRNVSVIFDPDQVYFIGEYAAAGACFDERLKKKLSQFRYYGSSEPFETFYEQMSMQDMNAVGAVVAVTDHYFNDPQLYS